MASRLATASFSSNMALVAAAALFDPLTHLTAAAAGKGRKAAAASKKETILFAFFPFCQRELNRRQEKGIGKKEGGGNRFRWTFSFSFFFHFDGE